MATAFRSPTGRFTGTGGDGDTGRVGHQQREFHQRICDQQQAGPLLGPPESTKQLVNQGATLTTPGEKRILVPAAKLEAVGVGIVVGTSAAVETALVQGGKALDTAHTVASVYKEEAGRATLGTAAITHSPAPRDPVGFAAYAVTKIIMTVGGFH
jgi:hypothetical protein